MRTVSHQPAGEPLAQQVVKVLQIFLFISVLQKDGFKEPEAGDLVDSICGIFPLLISTHVSVFSICHLSTIPSIFTLKPIAIRLNQAASPKGILLFTHPKGSLIIHGYYLSL